MAKIGTAHVEIKPVISDEALEALMQRIEDAVAEGVRRGLARQQPYPAPPWIITCDSTATVQSSRNRPA